VLKALGNGICQWINLLRCLASLYAGAPRHFITGLIGHPILYTFDNSRILGAVGFISVNFVLLLWVGLIGNFLLWLWFGFEMFLLGLC
jgi:hypothetical protein